MVRLRLGIALALSAVACVMMLLHLFLCLLAGNSKRGFVVAFGIDQAANGSLGGDPDETLCSRAYRDSTYSTRWEWFRRFFDWLFSPIEDNHCENVFLRELAARRKWEDKR